MMAMIVNGVVVWITTSVQASLYPASAGLVFVAIPTGATVEEGYLYSETGGFSPPPAPPAPPAPGPMPLTPLEFIGLVQSQGGMTDAQLVASKADTNLAALWLKLSLATEVYATGAITAAGMAALQAGGYLSADGAAAVIANWPTTPQID
jgi:hypothetical protein